MSKNKEIKKVEKVEKIEIVKRKDYKDLVNFLRENRDFENREIVKSNYEKIFKLKFSNIERLIKRSLREESKENFEKNLESNNLSREDYLKISYKIIDFSKNKKNILVEAKIKE